MTTTWRTIVLAVVVLLFVLGVGWFLGQHTRPPAPGPTPAQRAVDTLVITQHTLDTVSTRVIAYVDTGRAHVDTSVAQAAILDRQAVILADSGRWQEAFAVERARGDTLVHAVDSLRVLLDTVMMDRGRWRAQATSATAQAASLSHDLTQARASAARRLHFGLCGGAGATMSHARVVLGPQLSACGSYALW